MDYISLTRFESISKELSTLNDKLSGLGITKVRFQIQSDQPNSDEAVITVVDDTPVSPIAEHLDYSTKIVSCKQKPPATTSRSMVSNLKTILRHGGRGFLIGYIAKFLFNCLPLLIRSRLNPFTFIKLLKRSNFTQPLHYGYFLSSFLTVFHSIMYATKTSNDLSKHARAFLAGSVAGLSIFLVPQGDRTGISIFLLVRALEVIARVGVDARILPNIPHADALLFGIATAQITWSWIFAPWSLDRGYIGFLNKHTGRREGTLQPLAYLHQGVRIPGSVEEGLHLGYTPVKDWQKGIGIDQMLQHSHHHHTSLQSLDPLPSPTAAASLTTSTTAVPIQSNAVASSQRSILSFPSIISNLFPSSGSSQINVASPIASAVHAIPTNAITPPAIFHNTTTQLGAEHYLPDVLTSKYTSRNFSTNPAHRPSSLSLLPDHLVQLTNAFHKQRGQKLLTVPTLIDREKLLCHILHPHCPQSCLCGNLVTYPSVFKQSIQTYLPVYVLPGLIFRHHTLVQQPGKWTEHVLTSTVRSASFFANMTFLSHLLACYTRMMLPLQYRYHHALMPSCTGVAAYISVLGEQKTKRIELGLFAFSHAIKSVVNLLLDGDTIPFIPWVNSLLFALASGVLFSTLLAQPKFLRPSYFSLLSWFIGKNTPGLTCQDILSVEEVIVDRATAAAGDQTTSPASPPDNGVSYHGQVYNTPHRTPQSTVSSTDSPVKQVEVRLKV